MATQTQISDIVNILRDSVTELLVTADRLSGINVSYTALGLASGGTALDDNDMIGSNDGITATQINDALYAIGLILAVVNSGNRTTLELIRTTY